MIYITHGTVPSWSNERISHSLFLPDSQVARHLRLRREKYVPLAQAISGHGDALTIDDATYGALRLALMARRYGHAVTWFVNGSHVEQGLPYYPFQISSMLDNTSARDCRFDGETWTLHDIAGRRALRRRIKEFYMRMASHGEIEELIHRLGCCLHIDPTQIERSLSTVAPADLIRAALAGVELQNHGWGHLNPMAISEHERNVEVAKNEEYLSQFRQVALRAFAPPFGEHVGLALGHADFILLANRNLVRGHREGNLVNRVDLFLHNFSSTTPEKTPAATEKTRMVA